MVDESIVKTLGSYDGKRVAPFRAITDQLAIRPDALEVVISIIESDSPHSHVGGTWILKRLLELGLEPDDTLSIRVTQWLEKCSEKDARLHLLQTIDIIEIQKECHKQLYEIARALTKDKNTLVRAWAYNALGVIALQNSTYQTKTLAQFHKALETESPAVKARIRNSEYLAKNRD